MAKQYRVNYAFSGFDEGVPVGAGELAGLNTSALVQGGFLEEKAARVACPACSEDRSVRKTDVPNFQKADTLEEHYAKEHPALAPPDWEEVV